MNDAIEPSWHMMVRPIFDQVWIVVVLTAALLLIWWFVRPESRIQARRRRILRGIRLAAIVIIVLAMLRPTIVRTTTREERAGIVFLLDRSRSMTLPSREPAYSRWEAQRRFFDELTPLLRKLNEHVDIGVYLYDEDAQAVEPAGDRWPLPRRPGQGRTDIGGSLQIALQQVLGRRLLAVVVMGDGNQTVFEGATDPYASARELGAAGTPLWAVPWGPTGSAAQARDIAVEQFPERIQAFVKNEMEVTGAVRIRGLADREVPVELWLTDESDQPRKIAEVKVQSEGNNAVLPVRIPFVPEEPGQYRLTLRVPQQVGELLLDNNELTAFLSVREGGLRVLYLEGELRQEQKFIRWSLDASPDIEVDFQWFPRRQQDRWPISLGAAVEPERYDVFLIGDLPAAAVKDEDWSAMAERISEGSGMMMLGGYRSFGVGGYAKTAIAQVLPVQIHQFTLDRVDEQSLQRWHIANSVSMVPVRDHPVTRLGERSRNQEIWSRLPPLKGANRFRGVKQSPGVQVLLESRDGAPLLVAGEYGQGRVLAFAGDSTWQWWRVGKQSLHKRFWRQVVLWLAKRDEDDHKEVWADLSRRRFLPGAEVTVEGGVRMSSGEVVRGASMVAEFTRFPRLGDAPQRFSLAYQAEEELFRAKLPKLTVPGTYRVKVTGTADGVEVGSTEIEFQVLDRDLELASHAVDMEYLSRLTSFSSDVGGQVMMPAELKRVLLQWTKEPPQAEEPVLERWTLGESGPDGWLLLLVFTGLLSTEWILRRRWGLA